MGRWPCRPASSSRRRHRGAVAAAATVAAIAGVMLGAAGSHADAQARQWETGNVYGKVLDDEKKPLPGATVTLSTASAADTRWVQVTDARGQFRFLELAPAAMTIRSELEGFRPVEYAKLVVTAGRNTTVEITMEEARNIDIQYSFETPFLDPRQLDRGVTVSTEELREVLTARQPWTLAASAPGVLASRIDPAGGASGRWETLAGPGATSGNSAWALDGVVVTDMAVPGAAPSDFGAGALEEIQVGTGGSDATIATGGMFVNLVTKRGTNEWRGSARCFETPGGTESRSAISHPRLAAGELPPAIVDGIAVVRDGGAEAGGPMVEDHAWFWGAYDDREAGTVALGGTSGGARLPIWNGKLNALVSANNSLTLSALQDQTTVAGRDAGPQRTQPTTWDQARRGGDPTVARADDTQIFTSDFYLTGLFSAVDGGFALKPEGGSGPVPYLDAGGVWHGSYLAVETLRPQRQGKLDGSAYSDLGGVSHEIKLGAAYRGVETDSTAGWGDGLIVAGAGGVPGANLFAAARESSFAVRNTYTSGYAQDTIAQGGLTANAGVRYDVQRGHDLASAVAANPAFPGLLPGYRVAGGPSGVRWSDLSPRAGAAYTWVPFGRQTMLRASYSRYADQLGAAFAAIRDPAAALAYYDFSTPQTGPGLPAMLLPNGPPQSRWSGNLDPRNGLPLPLDAVDPRFSAPRTDEVLASVEQEVVPKMAVGLELTWRRLSNLTAADTGATTNPNGALAGGGVPLVFDDPNPFAPANLGSVGRPATRADFVQRTATVTLPDGRRVTVTYDVLAPGVSTRGGTWLTNSGRSAGYDGAALTCNRTLADRWAMRGSFTWSNWTYGRSGAVPDPTDFLPGGNRAGDAVLTGGGGPGAQPFAFLNARWSGYLDGVVQVAPQREWSFNLGGDLTARQGYPLPLYVRIPLDLPNYSAGLSEDVLVGRPDAVRLPAVFQLDARITKPVSVGDLALTLSVDCFNLLNAAPVTQRVGQLGLSTSDYVEAILDPRIYRFGVRIEFR